MKITFIHILLNQPLRPHSPPLGPLYLVSVLRQAGYDVDFRQFTHLRGTPLSIQMLADFLMSVPDGILATSSMINALPLLLLAIPQVRRRRPGLKVIAGGPGYNGIAESLLSEYPIFDAVATGEAEAIIVSLIEALFTCIPLDFVPGISFKAGGVVRTTPSPQRIGTLDALPYPAFDLIDFGQYHNVPMIASRGCPYSCTFCDVAPAWGRKHRRRSPDDVVAELHFLRERYKCTEVGFVDDLFVLDRSWVRRFCGLLVESGLDMRWRCTGHINLMDDDLLMIMRDAGCEAVFFGIESGSDRVLRQIEKGFCVDKILDTVQRTLLQIAVNANLMWGFPEETPSDIEQTIWLRHELARLGASCSLVFLAPLASASLYRTNIGGTTPLVFSPGSPNIFYGDYVDLIVEDRQRINSMISASPNLFCAFYYYQSKHLEEIWERIRLEFAAEWVQSFANPAWEMV